MSEISLTLSTAVVPPKKILLDDVEYDMLNVDHLSPEAEAEVLALFSRHSILVMELENERNVPKGKIIAERIREVRFKLMRMLTTMPRGVVEELPLTAQVKLLEALRAEIVGTITDDEEDKLEETEERTVSEPSLSD